MTDNFRHIEHVTARTADPEREAGWFDVIDDGTGDGPYVFDCGAGMKLPGTFATDAEAIAKAHQLADAYDAAKLEAAKPSWEQHTPGWTAERIEGNRSLAAWRVVSRPMSRMQADTLVNRLAADKVQQTLRD